MKLKQDVAVFLAQLAKKRQHHIACAILLDDGRRVFGINIVSNLGPASVCAEQTALGESLKAMANARILLILTLRATFESADLHEIVSPCGRCREILFEYAEDAFVALADSRDPQNYDLVPIHTLLPRPFYRRVGGT